MVSSLLPVTIVIPAFNQLEYCHGCIQSLQANTEHPYRLVLVDNGSTDGVAEYFDSVPGATVIHAPENLGFAGGVNLGLAVAEGHVVLLNSDTLLSQGWLSQLTRALMSAPSWGAIGPVTNCASGAQQLDGLALETPEALLACVQERWERYGPVVTEASRLVGFCMMLRDGVWQNVGEFDTRFAVGNYEDDDYCTRIRKAGYRLGIAQGCFVFHYGGRTFEGMGLQGESYNRLLNENRIRYMEKWDVYLPEPGKGGASQSAAVRTHAEAALARGDLRSALKLFGEAIRLDSTASGNFFGMGAALAQASQFKLALDAYRAGLKLAPGNAAAQAQVGELSSLLNKDSHKPRS